MKRWTKPAITILALLATGRLAGAQAGDMMSKPMGKDTTYTGCVEAGMAAGRFTLTHVTADIGMHKDGMKTDSMKNDAMAKDEMRKDSMAKDAMGKDAMMPTTLVIVGQGVDLSKHVGHRVAVTGRDAAMGNMEKSDGMGRNAPAFSVSSIKMIASTCGM